MLLFSLDSTRGQMVFVSLTISPMNSARKLNLLNSMSRPHNCSTPRWARLDGRVGHTAGMGVGGRSKSVHQKKGKLVGKHKISLPFAPQQLVDSTTNFYTKKFQNA